MIETVRILRPSCFLSSLVMYDGSADSTSSQCCINFGHFRANKIKLSTPDAVVEKNAKGTVNKNYFNKIHNSNSLFR